MHWYNSTGFKFVFVNSIQLRYVHGAIHCLVGYQQTPENMACQVCSAVTWRRYLARIHQATSSIQAGVRQYAHLLATRSGGGNYLWIVG